MFSEAKLKHAVRLWLGGASDAVIARNVGIRSAQLREMVQANPSLFPARQRLTEFSVSDDVVRGQPPPKVPGTHGVPALLLQSCMCRFPLWRDSEKATPTSLHCGEPTGDGDSYCAFHAEICTGPGTTFEQNAIRFAKAQVRRESPYVRGAL